MLYSIFLLYYIAMRYIELRYYVIRYTTTLLPCTMLCKVLCIALYYYLVLHNTIRSDCQNPAPSQWHFLAVLSDFKICLCIYLRFHLWTFLCALVWLTIILKCACYHSIGFLKMVLLRIVIFSQTFLRLCEKMIVIHNVSVYNGINGMKLR